MHMMGVDSESPREARGEIMEDRMEDDDWGDAGMGMWEDVEEDGGGQVATQI